LANFNSNNFQAIQYNQELKTYIEKLNSYIQQRELDFVNHIRQVEKQIYSECENTTQHMIHHYNINIQRLSNELNSTMLANTTSLKSK